MKRLWIDDKYAIEFDPDNNDKPGVIYRHGEPWADWDKIANPSNLMLAMFYALLAREHQHSWQMDGTVDEGTRYACTGCDEVKVEPHR